MIVPSKSIIDCFAVAGWDGIKLQRKTTWQDQGLTL